MDILWVGLGISAVVGFVFYILACYWQRLLRAHSRAIRDLSRRIEAFEEMEDPRFRRKIGDSAPSPLEQVYIFSFRLGERFWSDAIGATDEQLRYIRDYGKFLGSAKIERWRSHITVTLNELLPQNQSAGWQTRTVDIYPTKDSAVPAVLWELYLESPANTRGAELPPALELRYEAEALVLRARHCKSPLEPEGKHPQPHSERTIFHVPLDSDRLAAFRVSEDAGDGAGDGEPQRDGILDAAQRSSSWLTFYGDQDEHQAVDWQLCLRDLDRKAAWEGWNIVEPWQAKRVS